jgi:hypothetical protein
VNQARLRLAEHGEPEAVEDKETSTTPFESRPALASLVLVGAAREFGAALPAWAEAVELSLVGRRDLGALRLREVSDELRAIEYPRIRGGKRSAMRVRGCAFATFACPLAIQRARRVWPTPRIERASGVALGAGAGPSFTGGQAKRHPQAPAARPRQG